MTKPRKVQAYKGQVKRRSTPSTARSLTISCIVAVAVAYGIFVAKWEGGWVRPQRWNKPAKLPPQAVVRLSQFLTIFVPCPRVDIP